MDPVADVLHSLMTSVADPISGGRHKVFGSVPPSIVPPTSTIASHLPRAVGLAFALERARRIGVRTAYPADAVVVTSLGDASVNHSTAQGALNAAGRLTHRRVPLPLLVVVEDNGLGISVRTPPGWLDATLGGRPGPTYLSDDGTDPAALLRTTREAAELVRRERRPVVLHLRTVRLMGHAGSDVEMAYRTAAEIQADEARDPVEATALGAAGRGRPGRGGARGAARRRPQSGAADAGGSPPGPAAEHGGRGHASAGRAPTGPGAGGGSRPCRA